MVDPAGFDLDSCEQTQYHIADWKSGVDVRSQARSGSVGCLTINPLPGRLTSLTPRRGVRRGSRRGVDAAGFRPLRSGGRTRRPLECRGLFSGGPTYQDPESSRRSEAARGAVQDGSNRTLVGSGPRCHLARDPASRKFGPDPCGPGPRQSIMLLIESHDTP